MQTHILQDQSEEEDWKCGAAGRSGAGGNIPGWKHRHIPHFLSCDSDDAVAVSSNLTLSPPLGAFLLPQTEFCYISRLENPDRRFPIVCRGALAGIHGCNLCTLIR